MNDSKSKKIVLVAAIVILILVISLIVYLNSSGEDKFKYYYNHDITNNLKELLPKDYISDKYLISLMMLDNYNGVINENNINDILLYYMTSITTSEKYKDNDSDVGFCLSKESFDDSLFELFGIDSSSIYQLYYLSDYIEIKNDNVCFKYSYFDINDLDYYIAIDNMSVDNNIIKAKFYLYGLDSDSSEESRIFKEDLLSAINNKSLNSFNYLYNDNDLVSIEEKEIKFKEIPNGEYFKYQLISINTK